MASLDGLPPEATAPETVAEADIDFRTVVCGVDTSAESLEAVRQAVRVGGAGPTYWAASAWDPGVALYAGVDAARVMARLREESASALRRAREELPQLKPLLMRGADAAALLAAVSNLEADLVCVGSHGGSRLAGVLFGSVATAITHFAVLGADWLGGRALISRG